MKRDRLKAEDYSRAVMKTVVSQICMLIGFAGAYESALDNLSDAALRYIGYSGKASSFYAGLSGRTELNFFDIARGLEDTTAEGFSRGPKSNTCSPDFFAVKKIIRDVDFDEESPFALPIATYPIPRVCKEIPPIEKLVENPLGKHIPSWLPAFPEPHTYMHTPLLRKKSMDPRGEKLEQSRQRRKAERAFFNLQQRLIGVVNRNEGAREFPFDDNNVISADAEKTKVSVMEAFTPALQCMKGEDDEDMERNSSPEKRSSIHFRMKSGKKFAYESPGSAFTTKAAETKMNGFLRESERDEKKRRAEFILRQSVENPQELTQL